MDQIDGGSKVKLAVGGYRKNESRQKDYGILEKAMANTLHHLHLICLIIYSLFEMFSF
jgi:hypothetical protein